MAGITPRHARGAACWALLLITGGCIDLHQDWTVPAPGAEPKPIGAACTLNDRLVAACEVMVDGCPVTGTPRCEAGVVRCPVERPAAGCEPVVPPMPCPAPTDEQCNGHDDDCDGRDDEGLLPRAERCNGLDDDCDGWTDEGFDALAERCDGTDDDCDGAVDEDFADLGEPCIAGLGVCAVAGVRRCDAEGDDITCLPVADGQPAPTVDGGRCDGIDDDCDGRVDEHPPCNGGPRGTRLDGPDFYAPGVETLAWVYIGPREYTRGSDIGDPDEGPAHQVVLTRPFLIASSEVTIAQWSALMREVPSFRRRAWGECDTCPIDQVNWYEALAFANQVTVFQSGGLRPCYVLHECQGEDQLGFGCADGRERCHGAFWCRAVEAVPGCTGYRLPTEAEWELAARGGSESVYWFGDDEAELAMHENCANEEQATVAYADRPPNGFGLRHVHGNVGEWTFDVSTLYAMAPTVPLVDPVHAPMSAWPDEGPPRVYRGNSAGSGASGCRSASRSAADPHAKRSSLGFRLVRDVHVEVP